jgi:hypothetical protein
MVIGRQHTRRGSPYRFAPEAERALSHAACTSRRVRSWPSRQTRTISVNNCLWDAVNYASPSVVEKDVHLSGTENPFCTMIPLRPIGERVRTPVLAAIFAGLMVLVGCPPALAAKPPCDRAAGQFVAGKPITPSVSLSPLSESVVFNFESDTVQTARIDINAASTLPDALTPDQIDLDLPGGLRRVSDTLPTVNAAQATFTKPVFDAGGQSFHFNMCIDSASLHAGSYSGIVTIDGPRGLGRTSVRVTVNKKNPSLFWAAAIVTLIIAMIFLLYKEVTNTDHKSFSDWKTDATEKWKKDHPNEDQPEDVTAWRTFILDKTARFGVGFLLLEFLVPLAIAFGAMYAVYSKDPAWGADALTAWFALIGTALAAAGLRSLVVAGRQ